MAYSDKVVQRFEDVLKNPEKHAVGRFDPNDADVATGMTGAPACGDVMKLQLKLDKDEKIVDVKFKKPPNYTVSNACFCSDVFSKRIDISSLA